MRVAAVVGGSDGAWSEEGRGTPKSVYLSADTVTRTTATLTLGGHTGNWWWTKDGGATCSNTGVSGDTLSLTDLSAGTTYTINAFSNSGCGPTSAEIAAVTFSTAAAVTLSASSVEATTATLTIANHTGAWYYKYTVPATPAGSCSSVVASGTTTASLTGLAANTNHTFKAYSDSGCTTELTGASTDADFLTKPGKPTKPAAATSVGSGKLTVTASVTGSGTLSKWQYQQKEGNGNYGSWQDISSTSTSLSHTVSGLTNGTDYQFKVRAVNATGDGATSDASTAARPVAVTLGVSSKSATAATLTLGGYAGNWWWTKDEESNCSNTGISGNTLSLSNLTKNTSYTIHAWPNSNCSPTSVRLTQHTFTTLASDATLAGSSVEADTATLTISNYTDAWYYKYTAPSGGECSSEIAAGTSTASLTGLAGNTNHTFKAYSNSGCTTELTGDSTDAEFLTKPGKPAKPVAAAGAGSGKLTITASVTGDGTLSNWQYQQKEGSNNYGSWTDISSTSTSLSHTVSGLTDGTNYQYKVRAVNTTGNGAASDASTAAAPAAPTLAGSSVEATTATLAISNWTGDWYYKYTSPSGGDCSASAVSTTTTNLTGLSSNTNYTFKAYSDSGCSTTALATASSFLTKPGKPTTPAAATNVGSGKLTITASVTGSGTLSNWQYQQKEGSNNFGSWTNISSTSTSLSHTVSGLTDGTDYQYKVRAVNATGDGAASDASTAAQPAAPTLAGSSVEAATATLTIGNWTGSWYFKYTAPSGGDCSASAVSTTTKDLTGLSTNTDYTYKAYSDSGCSTLLATASSFLTKPGKPTKPVAASGGGSGKLTITASVTGSGTLSNWQYQQKEGGGNFGSWTDISSTSTSLSHTVSGLTNGTDYQFKVRAVNATGAGAASDASDAAQPRDETLTVSNVEATTATLAIGNHPANWYYKANAAPHASCSSAVSTTSVDLTGLSTNTNYTYKAYSDSGCTTELVTATLLTKPGKPTKPVAAVGAGSGKLTITASVTGDGTLSNWQYQQKEGGGNYGSWTDISSTSTSLSHTVSGLTNGTNYQYKVRAVNATGDGATSDASTAARPAAATLAGSSVEATTATLTIGNWTGDWYYKYTSPSGGDCSASAVSATTKDIADLSSNTSYIFKAYSDSGCSTLLATASSFLTKPGKPTKPSAGSGAGSGKLTFKTSVTGDGTLRKWQYQQKKGNGNFGSWIDISSTSTTLFHTVSGLTDRADYQFKVRAVNATGTGAASDASDAVQPRALTLAASSVEATTATLVLGNWTSNWYYKYTAPSGGTCSTNAVSGTTEDLTGLATNTNYTFKAYSDSGCSTTALVTAPSFLTKPGKPTKPVAAVGAGSGKLTITASVTGDGTPSKWQYQQKEGSGNYGSWTNISSTSTSLSHTVSGLTNRTDYRFKVRAVNATGDGAESDESSPVQVPDVPPAPSKPTAAVTGGGTSVELNWTMQNDSGAPVTTWQYVKKAGGNAWEASWTTMDGIDGSTTTFTVTGLSPNTSYLFKVRGVNITGPGAESPASDAVQTSSSGPGGGGGGGTGATPSAPTALAAAAGDGLATLTWTPGDAGGLRINEYQYRQREAGGGWGAWTDICTVDDDDCATRTGHTVTGLTNGTAYTFQVRAVNALGAGEASAESNQVIPSAGASVPIFVDGAGGVTVPDQVFAQNAPIEPLVLPAATGGDHGLTYALSPAPPAGLSFDPATRTLSGTPTAAQPATLYTWSAMDVDGDTAYLTFTIEVRAEVEDLAPSFGAERIPDLVLRANQVMEPMVLPAATGGDGELTYALSPELPAGLSFDPATRVLSGLPTEPVAARAYEYTATDSDVSEPDVAALTFMIEVEDRAPDFGSERVPDLVLRANQVMEPLVLPEATGGDGELTYALSPELPAGLSFDPATRVLSGLPTEPVAARAYEYTATDSDVSEPDVAALTFMIEVEDRAPDFGSERVPDLVLRANQVMEPLVLPEATGGDGELTYALSPELPAGLSFDPATRVLSGLPTEPVAARAYEYTATDSDVSEPDVAALTFMIEVEDRAPDFGSERVPDLVLRANQVMEPLVLPEATGGDGELTYALSPELPAGLSFDPATRVLSGLPTEPVAARAYEYTATDSDVSEPDVAALTFMIEVEDRAPDFGSERVPDLVLRANQVMEPLVLPEATGGDGELTYALSPELPAGLSFDPATRVLSGLPTEPVAARAYEYTATDSDVSEPDVAALTFMIEVEDRAPDFGSERVPDLVLRANQVMEPLVLPEATGGDGELTYALSPELPAGLSFDPATRVLSGLPTEPVAARAYEYTATDSDVSEPDVAALTFMIEVEDRAPDFGSERVPDLVLRANQVMEPLVLPEATGGDGELTYALSPELPAGLSFDPATRVLSGLPTEPVAARAYEYTATDSDVSEPDVAALTFMIEVEDRAPDFGSERVPDLVLRANQVMEPLVLPEATGGDGELTYALSPELPAGLSFDPATRVLSGLPTEPVAARAYEYTATDSDVSEPTWRRTFMIEVEDRAPDFGSERGPGAEGQPGRLVLPEATGGDGELTYALSPMPAGLSFDPATRVLSGLPTEPVAARAYEYTATDSDVSEPDVAALTFMIEVEDRAPDFGSERVPDLVLRANQVMEPLVLPEATGGDGELTYALSPELPAGLSFDPATRVLSGLPTEPVAARAYEYTATDSDVSEPDVAALTFMIEVEDRAPDFGSERVPDLVLRANQVMEPLVLPEATGGDGELTYALSPELPAGLSFDPATRVLSGLPTEVTERRSFEYTVVDSDRLEPDAAALTFTIEVTYSAADKAILNDALAAQGRALLTNTAGAIGERFRTPAAAPAAAATANRDDEDRAVAALNSLAMWMANRYGGVPPAGGAYPGAGGAYPGAGGAAGGLPPIAGDPAPHGFGGAGGTAPHGFGGAGAPMPGIGAGAGAGFGTATGPGVGAGAGFGTGSGAGLGAGTGFAGAGSSFAGAGSFGAGGSFGPSGPPPGADRPRDWNLDQLLQGRSFAIPLFAANDGAGSGNGGDGNNSDGNGDGAGGDNGYAPPSRWTLWGAATAQNFDGASENGRFQGGVTSMFLGADARLGGDWLAGAAISGSAGESDYTVDGREGRLETELAAFHPYIRGQFGSGLEVWALGGVGSGEAMDLSGPAGAAAATGETADLEMTMAAAGLRQPLNRRGPVEFSLVGGLGAVSLMTVEGDGLRAVEGLQADITQGRLGLEIAVRSAVSPYLRIGARSDGGDGRTGTGVEAVAGLRASSARVEFEAQARWLGAYSEAEFLQEGQDAEEAAYEEYGGMMRLIIKARPDGSGLQLTLSPTWGQMGGGTMLGGGGGLLGGPGGGALPLSGAGAMPGLGGGKADLSALTLESEFGYGFAFDRGLLVLGGAHARNGAIVRETVGLSWKSADRDPESKAGGSLQFTLGYDLPTPVEAGSPRLELIYSARF